MKQILATRRVKIPKEVTCKVKSRIVSVTGPRGTLTRSFRHAALDMTVS